MSSVFVNISSGALTFLRKKHTLNTQYNKGGLIGEIIDVDYVEVPSDPITETWYTCPACGSLVATGKPCDCGYCPAAPEKNDQPSKKQRSAAVPLLGVALAVSLAVCGILAGKLSTAQADILSKDAAIAANEKKISSYTATIDNLKNSNEYLEEYNAYLQDDLLHYNLPSDYTSTKNRHDLRIYNNPFLRAMQTP